MAMSTYFHLSDEEIKAILNEMTFNRKMGFAALADDLPSAEMVIQEVAKYYGSNASFKSKQMAIYLVRKLTVLSLTEIGELLNVGKAKVMTSIQTVEARLKKGDQETITTVKTIVDEIRRHYENG
jgi:chromosomal replication initiation ATPase DnaA